MSAAKYLDCNEPGYLFKKQERDLGSANPFMVLGLPPTKPYGVAGIRKWHRNFIIPHLMPLTVVGPGRTVGPNVPTWTQAQYAMATLDPEYPNSEPIFDDIKEITVIAHLDLRPS